jgi:hypothetical protein
MAYFEEEADELYSFNEFKAEDQIFTASLDTDSERAEVALMCIRRKQGDRILERLEIGGNLGRLLKAKYKSKDRIPTLSFMADLEFKNIRIAKYQPLELEEVKNDN